LGRVPESFPGQSMLGADSLAMTARMLVRSGRVLGTGRRTENAGPVVDERVKYFP
jgi:hypothetical protein